MDNKNNGQLEQITLGGGCFWCVEAVYQQVNGVTSVESGYAGGKEATADYRSVCSGSTQHAEVVQVTFDPALITLKEILDIFWTVHDPTTLNRQGNDKGPQYRSVIFYHDEQQQDIARSSIEKVAAQLWDDPIVTELSPLPTFYPAEAYHQNYYNKMANRNPYCSFVITPKINKFRKQFQHQLKSVA